MATFWRKETVSLDTYRDLVKLLHANLGALIISCLLQTALCAAIACRLADVIAVELAFVIAATVIAVSLRRGPSCELMGSAGHCEYGYPYSQ